MTNHSYLTHRWYFAALLLLVPHVLHANNAAIAYGDNTATAYASSHQNTAVAYGDDFITEDGEVFIGQQTTTNVAQNFASCPTHFYGGMPPVMAGDKGQKLSDQNYELCFHGFAVLYSGVSRTPLYSAQYLTKERIWQARTLARKDSFHEETRLPIGVRATLNDYRQSGYDRGHLSPNGDMADSSQQFDSFSLANIAPQNGMHNRGVWQDIEKEVRNMAIKYGELYVVTGVAFQGRQVTKIGQGVLVPTHFFKAVYVPKLARAGVYYSPNDDSGVREHISLDELSARTGIRAMPQVSPQVQATAFNLPSSSENVHSQTGDEEGESRTQGWFGALIHMVQFLVALLK